MSVHVMAWVMAHSPRDLTGAEQSVAIALANFASDDGRNAFPSVATLCQATHWSERTVVRALQELMRRGVVAIERPATNKAPAAYRFPDFRGVTTAPQEDVRGVRVTPLTDLGVSESPSRGVRVTPKPSKTRNDDIPPSGPPMAEDEPGRGARQRQTRLPMGFVLDDELVVFAEKRGWNRSRAEHEFTKFREYHAEHDNRRADWRASWRRWVLNGIGYDQRDRARTPANQNRGGTGQVVL